MLPDAVGSGSVSRRERRAIVERSANIVLAGASALGVAAFAYYCFRYAPAIDDQLRTPVEMIGGYFLVGAVPLVTLGALLLPRAAKIAAAGALVVSVMGVYATDAFLAITGIGLVTGPMWSMDSASPETRSHFVALARAAGLDVDGRDRLEVMGAMRAHGVDAVPAIMLADVLLGEDGVAQPAETGMPAELLPLGGIARAATVLCNESGHYVTYNSDRFGFRNPQGVWSAPRAEIAAIGQSLTQGYCVPDGAGFVDLLRPRYPATLNLGMSGESALLQLAAIKEYLLPYRPRVVLWFFYEGQDLHTLYEESTHPLVMLYLDPTFTQRLSTRQTEIDEALRRFVSDKEAKARISRIRAVAPPLRERAIGVLKLWHLRENLQRAYGVGSGDAVAWAKLEELAQNLLSDAFVQSNTLTRSWGGTLYFVYLPSWDRYHDGAAAAERDRLRVLNLVNTLGIPIVDIQAAFTAHPDPLSLFPFRKFGHYNEAGNRIVADALLRILAAHDRHESSGIPGSSSLGSTK